MWWNNHLSHSLCTFYAWKDLHYLAHSDFGWFIALPAVCLQNYTCNMLLASGFSGFETLMLVWSVLWVTWDRNQSLRETPDKPEHWVHCPLLFLTIGRSPGLRRFPPYCLALCCEGGGIWMATRNSMNFPFAGISWFYNAVCYSFSTGL